MLLIISLTSLIDYATTTNNTITQTKNAKRRLMSTLRVANRLMEFADRFDFSGDDGEFKNWLYVRNFGQYSAAFRSLSHIKDTTFVLPEYYLARFRHDCWAMMPNMQVSLSKRGNRTTKLRRLNDFRFGGVVGFVY